MAIPVVCINGHSLNVPEKYLGKTILCPKCQASTLVEQPLEPVLEMDDDPFGLNHAGVAMQSANPLSDPLLGSALPGYPAPNQTGNTAYTAPVRSAQKAAAPHWLETGAGKASTVGGGIALGSLSALLLLGFISLFRGGTPNPQSSSAPVAHSDPAATSSPTGAATSTTTLSGSKTAPDPNHPVVREATRKMREIMLAMYNYQDKQRRFPGGSSKVSGLSWRVHLLPFLKQDELFAQFKMDEPWDSPHNQALISQMPDVFRLGNASEPTTRFQVIRGDDLVFGHPKPQGFDIFIDGIEQTLICLAVGSDKAVPWTQPDDFEWDRERPIESLGQIDGQTIVAVVGDKVIGLGSQVAPEKFVAMVTPQGGEIVDPMKLMEQTLHLTHSEFNASTVAPRVVSKSNDNKPATSKAAGAKLPPAEQVQLAAHGLLCHQFLFHRLVPPSSDRPGGKLSWRVHILPLIGETELYQKFNLEEPWDGPTNSKLLDQIPAVYNSGIAGKTQIRGLGKLLGPQGVLSLQFLKDDPGATLLTMRVAPSMAVEWTKPEELDIQVATLPILQKEMKSDAIYVTTCMGTTLQMDVSTAAQHLISLSTIDGGENLNAQRLSEWALPMNAPVILPVQKLIQQTTEQTNRLKTIVLAMQNYESAFRSLPPAKQTLTPEGKENLSWRVHLLPFLDQNNLYQKFNLKEPWDSPQNLQLLEHMPTVFAEPGDSSSDKTAILKVSGPDTIYPTPEGTKIFKVRDGGLTVIIYKSNADKKVPWTKPDDPVIEMDNIKSHLGPQPHEFFQCAMVDGRVSTIKMSLPAQELGAIFTASGGETLPNWMSDYGGNW